MVLLIEEGLPVEVNLNGKELNITNVAWEAPSGENRVTETGA